MVIRESYLRRIRPFYHQNLIKVIVGVRRCGKSVLLKQIREDLVSSGVPTSDIALINFESFEHKNLRDADQLYRYLKEHIATCEKAYILLDEIQLVEGFEDVVNSLHSEGESSIFVTGSNSRLLAGELATLLSGRYVSFQVMPFNFREYVQYRQENAGGLNYPHNYPFNYAPSPENLLQDYLRWGGFPLVCAQSEDDARYVVIDDLYTSIVLRDIMDRNNVAKGEPLQNVLNYLIANSSNFISGKKIADTLTSNNQSISATKVYEYLRFIQDAFIVSLVDQYDISGKTPLKYEKKGFVCDLGLFHAKKNPSKNEFSHIAETVVYNELISRGLRVSVGKTQRGEIDFVVMQGEKRCYIQVAYLMQDEATVEREFGAFDHVRDAYPKYVISMDPITRNINGVRHLKLYDFLMDDSLLVLG